MILHLRNGNGEGWFVGRGEMYDAIVDEGEAIVATVMVVGYLCWEYLRSSWWSCSLIWILDGSNMMSQEHRSPKMTISHLWMRLV